VSFSFLGFPRSQSSWVVGWVGWFLGVFCLFSFFFLVLCVFCFSSGLLCFFSFLSFFYFGVYSLWGWGGGGGLRVWDFFCGGLLGVGVGEGGCVGGEGGGWGGGF